MAKRSRTTTDTGASPLPTRDEVLAYVAAHPGAGRRDIVRAFGIRGDDRRTLNALLKDLAGEGLVERKKGRIGRPGDLPPVGVLVVTGRDRDGDLVATPSEWGEEHGDPPRILVHVPRGVRPPGIGDRVLARLAAGDGGYDARIIKVLDKKPGLVLGVVRIAGDVARIEPVDRKQKALMLDPGGLAGAKEGDLVSVTVTRSAKYGLDRAVVSEVIGSMRNEKAVSLIAILAHAIPHEMPEAALREAETAKAAPLRGRDDWRELPLLTIDPADAKDHDDAV
ncbi:MAG TPA: ribonuclease R, partial [Bauldia sp.]|nr:ribonuclease R [Bauldia sp.]